MPLKCRDIIMDIEKKYPLRFAEEWDNVGLLIGDYDKEISKILICLEIDNNVADEAIDNNVDMIISHHPLLFKPLKKLVNTNYISSIAMKLIRADINVYSMHTNFDNADDGMNDILVKALDLKDSKVLSNNKSENLYKLVVFVPLSHQHVVRDAIMRGGAGHIGNYSHCSFNSYGTGTFKPLEGTSPFIGKQGEIEKVNEARIETIVQESLLSSVIGEMLGAHPYEEVAYDVYPLKNRLVHGTGRYGTLQNTMTFKDFCEYVKQKLNIDYLNAAGNLNKTVSKIAVVGGAGADFIREAVSLGCDVLITGDIKHHSAIDAAAEGLNIIDAGHYATEIVSLPHIAEYIKSISSAEVVITKCNTNPFQKL